MTSPWGTARDVAEARCCCSSPRSHHHGRPMCPSRATAAPRTTPRGGRWRSAGSIPSRACATSRARARRWFPLAWRAGGRRSRGRPRFSTASAGSSCSPTGSAPTATFFPFANSLDDRIAPFAASPRRARAPRDAPRRSTSIDRALGPRPSGFTDVTEFERNHGAGEDARAAAPRRWEPQRAGVRDGLRQDRGGPRAVRPDVPGGCRRRDVLRAADAHRRDADPRPRDRGARARISRRGDASARRARGARLPRRRRREGHAPRTLRSALEGRHRPLAARPRVSPPRLGRGAPRSASSPPAIAVGTIDQVLLSTLTVDHAHLRATTLLRQLLVVDEVHASDAYMTRLLDEVLRFHLDAGGHALLMSATLGSSARDRLFALGNAVTPTPLAAAVATPYPLVRTRRGARHALRFREREATPSPHHRDRRRASTTPRRSRAPPSTTPPAVPACSCSATPCATASTRKRPSKRSPRRRARPRCSSAAATFATPHHARFARADRAPSTPPSSVGTARPAPRAAA